MMNPEIRDQWATALESDEYTQGKERLTNVNPDGSETNCCLGVLCELAVKAGVISEGVTRINHNGRSYKAYGLADDASFLPAEVSEWAGIGGMTVEFQVGDFVRAAEWLNDVSEKTFPEIAQLIRTQL